MTESGYFSDNLEGPFMEHRCAVADEIRRYWEKYKDHSLQESWFGVLADDQGSPERWLDAAQRIVEPGRANRAADRSKLEGAITINGRLAILDNDRDFGQPLAGESLRGKRHPSVTELLVKRADQAADAAVLQKFDLDEIPACDLTLCLAKWDAKAAVPVIHRRFGESRRFERREGQGLQVFAGPLALLAEAGIQAGDAVVIDDYAAWMRSIREKPFDHLIGPGIFIPLWRHPENQKLAELARWMFLADESVWHPVHKMGHGVMFAQNLYASPLVAVPAFREMLKQELTDGEPVGTGGFDQAGACSFDFGDGGGGMHQDYAPDVEMPKAGAKQSLRRCDVYAARLSDLEGSPRFELYWPEGRRDAVLAEMARFLDRWGNCFRDQHRVLHGEYLQSAPAEFRLARLGHPATPEDVVAGRAIFSLFNRPDAKIRVVEPQTLSGHRAMEDASAVPPSGAGSSHPAEHGASRRRESVEEVSIGVV